MEGDESSAETDHSGVLRCSVSVERFNPLGGINGKPVLHKKCELRLGRNEFQEILIRLENPPKPTQSFLLHNFQIFAKFLKEGKATVKFADAQMQLMISNCPPDKLSAFLKTISVKITCMRKEGRVTAQAVKKKLASDRNPNFQLISPLNAKNAAVVEKVIGGGGSRQKRGLDDMASPVATKKRKMGSTAVAQGKENSTSPHVPTKTRKQLSRMLTSPKAAGGLSTSRLFSPPNKEKILKQMTADKLTATQRQVLEMVRRGQSVFFTGAAGTGKSFLTKKIIGALPPDQTFVTASTAIAACHIGGTTLHSFAGIGSGTQPLEQCIQLAKRNAVKAQWRKCRYLIVDEISMVDGDFFDKLESVARAVKSPDKPFGGITLVLCGDFLQLPPICKDKDAASARKKFCFQASSWSSCVSATVELKEIFRQSDQRFVKILQNLRYGRCTPEMAEILRKTSGNKLVCDGGNGDAGIVATKLFTHNQDVDYTNQLHLKRLEKPLRSFEAVDSDAAFSKTLTSLCPAAPPNIQLCVGAQVMLTKNMSVNAGLVNGARGVVTGFDKSDGGGTAFPKIRFLSGHECVVKAEKFAVKLSNGDVAYRRQLPMKLAWAISVHKSQGMTLDHVEMSLSRVFESGQVYVALSRAKALESVRITDFDPACVRANHEVVSWYKSMRENSALTTTSATTLRF